MYFSRSGSIVVIIAFLYILIGTNFEKITTDKFEMTEFVGFRIEIKNHIKNAERMAVRWLIFISTLGTFIWGYGDLLFDACNIIP